MRQIKPFTGKIRRRLIALVILATLAAIVFAYQSATSIAVLDAEALAQQRKTRPRPRPRPQTRASTIPAFSGFEHKHHGAAAGLTCSKCHVIPSQAAPDEIAAATKSSIKGYPYHDSCKHCHSSGKFSFFNGARPTICTVCHTRVSPRATKRDVYLRFPKHSEYVVELEFPGFFPHQKHAIVQFPNGKTITCDHCHRPLPRQDKSTSLAIAVSGGAKDIAEGAFKTSPSGHASCFDCHWQNDNPGVTFLSAEDRSLSVDDGCAGCHLTPADVAKKPRNQLSANAMEYFKNWPAQWPKRFSPGFEHESSSHRRIKSCSDCHKNVRQMETLDMVKADVSIETCATSNCHGDSDSVRSISNEMFAEETDAGKGKNDNPASREGEHPCTDCHSEALGVLPPPCSHLLLFADKADEFPNAVKQISKLHCRK